MLGKFGSKLNKAGKFLGKYAGKGLHTANSVNNWIGKTLNKGENLYGNIKKGIIDEAHKAGLGQEVKSIINHAEATPLGASLGGLYHNVKNLNNDIGMVLNPLEREVKQFSKNPGGYLGNKLKEDFMDSSFNQFRNFQRS